MKLGTYKEDGFITTYYEDGTIWSCVQNPFNPVDNWDELHEGYKFPEPDYKDVFSHCRIEIMDFGTSPPTILTIDEYNKLIKDDIGQNN